MFASFASFPDTVHCHDSLLSSMQVDFRAQNSSWIVALIYAQELEVRSLNHLYSLKTKAHNVTTQCHRELLVLRLYR